MVAHFWSQAVTLAPQFCYSTTTQGSPASTGPTSCLCNSGRPWKLHQPSNQSALKCISICCFPRPTIGSRSHLRVSMWPHLTSIANNLVTWRVPAPRLPLFVVPSAGVRKTGMKSRVEKCMICAQHLFRSLLLQRAELAGVEPLYHAGGKIQRYAGICRPRLCVSTWNSYNYR
jgi:hypothetical protein